MKPSLSSVLNVAVLKKYQQSGKNLKMYDGVKLKVKGVKGDKGVNIPCKIAL